MTKLCECGRDPTKSWSWMTNGKRRGKRKKTRNSPLATLELYRDTRYVKVIIDQLMYCMPLIVIKENFIFVNLDFRIKRRIYL